MKTMKPEAQAPTWYTEAEILEAIKRHGDWSWVPTERAAFIARHLQLAFSKGFQVRGSQVKDAADGR